MGAKNPRGGGRGKTHGRANGGRRLGGTFTDGLGGPGDQLMEAEPGISEDPGGAEKTKRQGDTEGPDGGWNCSDEWPR